MSGPTDSEAKKSTLQHPFFLEHVYREMASMVTGGDISDPEKVLEPILKLYWQRREELFRLAKETADETLRKQLEEETEKPWWRLMPITLPPGRSNHEFALAYALYRLMTNGNMTFRVGKELGDALFNTDFEVRMDELHFPADTFTVYYIGSSIRVFDSPLKYIFCDRVEYLGNRYELRIVYGYIDEDGDYANSGFQLFNYEPHSVVNSTELFASLEKEEFSEVSQMKVTDQHRENSKNVTTALFNFLLYIGSVGDRTVIEPPETQERLAKLSNPKKRRRLEKQMQYQTLFRYTYVGKQYESRLTDETRGTGESLEHRVLVRGHWRRQWVGKKTDAEGNRVPGSAQKLIWVEPYWKGPDFPVRSTTVRLLD